MVQADQLPAGKLFAGRLQLHRRKKLLVTFPLLVFLFGKNICSVHPCYSDVMKIKGNFLILFSCQIQLDILKLLTCFEGLGNMLEFFEGIMQEANQYVFLIYPAE